MDSNSWEIVDIDTEAGKTNNMEAADKTILENINTESSRNRYGKNVIAYETEWRTIGILSEDPQLTRLREKSINGELKISKFRSVCWNILLGGITGIMETWPAQRHQQRAKYKELKEKYCLNPHLLKEAEEKDNPLSQSKDSVWNQHFRDQELCNLIRQDVVRTNPTVEFYRKENIQTVMINILFCYAREYPLVCYRQGMHEILAPLIFVLHCDHMNLAHIVEEMNISLDPLLTVVLDPNYMEEDSYQLFCKIMENLELFYRINDMTITESGQLTMLVDSPEKNSPPKPASGGVKRSSEIEVVHQLNLIRDKILAKEDLHLHNHLLKLEIPLSLFGIRWLRLLFGREYTLLDLLVMWDAIIGVGDNLKFTYYILVAMLIRIRDKLLSADYTSCLTLLMRYPQNVDVMLVIRHALYMKSPDKYQCPANAFVYVVSNLKTRQKEQQILLQQQQQQKIQQQKKLQQAAATPSSSRANRSMPTNRFLPTSSNLAMATSNVNDYRMRSSSLPRKGTNVKNTVNEMRTESSKATLNYAAQSRVSADEDFGIVDGYLVDDPEVLKMELQDSYNIMSVSRIKLLQYVNILRKYIPGNQIDELHQTLDGLEELCALLKPKHQYLFNMAAPVDPAFEAGDDADQMRTTASSSRQQPPNTLNLKNTFKPMETQEGLNPRYEVPENRISKNASRMLQKNRKEVEMNVFEKLEQCSLDEKQLPVHDPVGERRSSE